MPCVGVWHSTETLLFPRPCGWCLLSSHLQWGCTSLVELGWLGGAAMESLPCASGCATKLPLARVRSCSAGMVLKIGPRCIFPLSAPSPSPRSPERERSTAMGGLLYIEVRGGGLRTRGSARAAGALVPCLLPLCFPPPCVSLPGAPLQPLAPGTSYFCLFLRKKNNIIKL